MLRSSLVMFLGIFMYHSSRAQEIWFSPYGRAEDFTSLFSSNAPWQEAASNVRVFEIADELIYDHSMTDQQLIEMFDDLRRRKIDVAVGIPVVTAEGRRGTCGFDVEGYGLAKTIEHDAKRIKALGGNPKFFSMDEPLYFGHVFDKRDTKIGCQLPIATIAKDAAEKLRQIHSAFPEARLGDVEPFPITAIGKDEWLSDIEQWIDAYSAATGDNLAFFRIDMAWNLLWRDQLPKLIEFLARRKVPLQVIYNGNGNDRTDSDWIRNAISHFKAYESEGRSPPSAAMIQSWDAHPTHCLPESNKTSMTALVSDYVKWSKARD